MFNLIGGLAKAAVGLVATPVAIAIDVALAPAKLVSDDPNAKVFEATEAALKVAADGVKEAGK